MSDQSTQTQTLNDSTDEFCYTLAFTVRRVLGLDERGKIDDEIDDD